MKNEKKKKTKIRTQNTHEFRSSFILNMNKKERKPKKKKKKPDKNMILT